MPGLYADGEYDLAGFIVGAVERKRLLKGEKIRAGDVLLALPSNGLHTNGYSLARKLLFEVAGYLPSTTPAELGCSVADELLKVHRSYLKPLRKWMDAGLVKGAAHITGGGITDNTPRMLPKNLGVEIDTSTWKVPAIFELLRSIGKVPVDDWRRSFNLGVGMIVAVSKRDAAEACKLVRDAWQIGKGGEVRRGRPGHLSMKRLGILLSGRGSNFEAIAANVRTGSIDAEIAVVLSSRADARGLETARSLGLDAVCRPSKGIPREIYDQGVAEELRRREVDLVCLAGYMRLLSPGFIAAFPMRILNIHPSLLPAFPGLDAQQQALLHGVKISGCTVHFVDEELDAGPIVLQAAVPVLDQDDAASLSARILQEEHRIYSQAIRLVLSGCYRIEGRRVIASSGQPGS